MKKRLLTAWLITCMMISLVGQTPITALAEGDDSRVISVSEGLQEVLLNDVSETPVTEDENTVVEIPEAQTEQSEDAIVEDTPGIELVQNENTIEDTPGIELVQNENTAEDTPDIELVQDENTVEDTPGIELVQNENTVEDTPGIELVQNENTVVDTTECINKIVDANLPQGTHNLGDIVRVSGLMPKDAIVEAIPVNVEIEGQSVLLAYDITIYENEEKKNASISWQPGEEGLSVEFISSALETTEEEVNIWHMEDTEETPEYVTAAPSPYGSVEFVAESFSVYVVTSTKLTATIVASDGNTYEINVTYTNQSGIPMDGTKLAVSELKSGDEGYDEYIEESASKVGTKAEDLEFSKVFDIKIVDENDEAIEYEPTGDVDVSIRVIGVSLSEYPQVNVLHFVEDRNDENFLVYDVASTVNGETVEFTTDSFSVYVVVGHEGDTQEVARRIYHFIAPEYTQNGSTYTAAPYMFPNKNSDYGVLSTYQCTQIILDGEKLEQIVNPQDIVDDNMTPDDSTDDIVSHFYGWYVVSMVSDTSDPYVGGGQISYTWGENPTPQVFNTEINFTSAEIAAKSDTHIYVAPIYVNYHFIKFHEIAKQSEDAEYQINNDYVPKLISRKMVALNELGKAITLVSDVTATPTDNIHYMFRGWEVYIDGVKMGLVSSNASLIENGNGKVTGGSILLTDQNGIGHTGTSDGNGSYIMTVDSSGNQIVDPIYYITLEGEHDVDLYPVFNEIRWVYYTVGKDNNKGSYVPSKLILTLDTENGDNTIEASELGVTSRNGYVFDGWYTSTTGLIELDSDGTFNTEGKVRVAYNNNGSMVFDSTFMNTYNSELNAIGGFYYDDSSANSNEHGLHVSSEWKDNPNAGGVRLTLYAHWSKVTTSQYKVVIWKQTVNDAPGISQENKTYDFDSYYLSDAFSTSTNVTVGESGTTINSFTGKRNGVGASATTDLANLGFTGFNYAYSDWSSSGKTIKPDGSTVINIYYDRITYNLKFFFARRLSNGTGSYEVSYLTGRFNSPAGANQQTWQNYVTSTGDGMNWGSANTQNFNNIYIGDLNKIGQANNGNYTYWYYTITANYGTDISNQWPVYGDFNNVGTANYTLSGWWLMRGARIYGGVGQNDTVKGVISTMDETILGNVNSAEDNFLLASYRNPSQNNVYSWTYNIYYETLPGVDYTGKTLISRGVKTYYLDNSFTARSSSTGLDQQNAPSYKGFYEGVKVAGTGTREADFYYDRISYDFSLDDNFPIGVIGGSQQDFTVYFDDSLASYGIKDADGKFVYQPTGKPDHYNFGGWYEDATCSIPFNFNQTMPAANKKIYAKWIEDQFGVEIDANGGVIDHLSNNPNTSGSGNNTLDGNSYSYSYNFQGFTLPSERSEYNSGHSTYVNLSYNENLGQYDLKRKYVPINADEAQELINGNQPVYYYINTLRTDENGNALDTAGNTGIPSTLRNAIFLRADDNDTELKSYFLFFVNSTHFTILWGGDRYADAIDYMEEDTNGDGKPDDYLRLQYLSQTDFNIWLGDIDDSNSNAYRLYNEWLANYHVKDQFYRKTTGDEEYQLLNWYIVYSDDPSDVGQIFNFNNAPNKHVVIKAEWRLNGRYHIEYSADGSTALLGKEVQAAVNAWRDPDYVDNKATDYADNTDTIVREQPRFINAQDSEDNVFLGWYIAGYKKKASGNGYETDPSVALDGVSSGKPSKFYDVGDIITVRSLYADPDGIIHMQAYFEQYDSSTRRPYITNLTLDANTAYDGSISDGHYDHETVAWTGSGSASVTNNGSDQFIAFGDIQSSTPVHLYRYATNKEFNSITGTQYFKHQRDFLLLGFDSESDPEVINYNPKYAADSVIGVTRNYNQTLYAVWEPLVYISFVNNTDSPVTIDLDGTNVDALSIVNQVTGEFDRLSVNGTTIVIPANTTWKLVMPKGEYKLYNAVITGHTGYEMSVTNAPVDTATGDPTTNPDIERVYNDDTTAVSGTLLYSRTGAIITIDENPLLTYDLNVGTSSTDWQEDSNTWVGSYDEGKIYRQAVENKEYTETINQSGTRKATEPAHPTINSTMDRADGAKFIGWTLGVSDGNGGYNAPGVFGGEANAYDGSQGALYNFNSTITEPTTLYVVWGLQKVSFDVNVKHNGTDYTWGGGPDNYSHTNGTDVYVTTISNPDNYKPNDPTRNDNKRFIGWVTEDVLNELVSQGVFSSLSNALSNTDWSGPNNGTISVNGTTYTNYLAYIKANLWDFTGTPPYGQTLYAIWSDTVTVTFSLQSRNNNNNLHTWNNNNDSNYYTGSGSTRTVTIAKGDMVIEPLAPTTSQISNSSFYHWWKGTAVNEDYTRNAVSLNNIPPGLTNSIWNFDNPIIENTTLYTSWVNGGAISVSITKQMASDDISQQYTDTEFTFNYKICTYYYNNSTGSSGPNKTTVSEPTEWEVFNLSAVDEPKTIDLHYWSANNRFYYETLEVCEEDRIGFTLIGVTETGDGDQFTSVDTNNHFIVDAFTGGSNYGIRRYNGGWRWYYANNSYSTFSTNNNWNSNNTPNTRTYAAVFTNERDTVDITVKKILEGSASGTFSFETEIIDGNKTITPLTDQDAFDLTLPGVLGSDEKVVTIPKGSTCTITETTTGYMTSYEIRDDSDVQVDTGTDLSVTLAPDQTIENLTVIFTNKEVLVAPTGVNNRINPFIWVFVLSSLLVSGIPVLIYLQRKKEEE